MISLSPLTSPVIYKKGTTSFKGEDVTDILIKGDKALNENKNSEALKEYQKAHNLSPDDKNVNRKLAKAQFKLKDYASASKNFSIYLEKYPEDVDCLIELGESYRCEGKYGQATGCLEKAATLDPGNDEAQRSLKEVKNNRIAVFNPQRAAAEKTRQASETLKKALDLTVQYFGQDYLNDLTGVNVQFGKTASMSGTPNIAQYEDSKKTITVTDSYIYAAPQVIAAYLTHECIHAKDKDPYTSVREEQDAYEVATKFWIDNSNGIKDPEMDYAADLYKKSPSTLSSRVAEIYQMRDSSIEMTSPNHPPQKFFFNKGKHSGTAAGQPLRHYDVIA